MGRIWAGSILLVTLGATALTAQTTVIPESFRRAAGPQVDIVANASSLRTVASLTLKITSKSDAWLKDAMIKCQFYGESRTKLGESTRTIYREFAPKKSMIAREINFGFVHQEARSVGCEVVSAEIGSPV